MPNIAIIWDFDKTLTPQDSTTEVVKYLQGSEDGGAFWKSIHKLRGDKELKDEDLTHILASDAPIWMYSLARLAFEQKTPLNSEFFEKFIAKRINLFPSVETSLKKIKDLSKTKPYKNLNLNVHHFIVSAGLKELIEIVMKDLVTWTFGCRYTVIASQNEPDSPESIPVYCIDETMKTRSIFEISKGSFDNRKISVNDRVANEKRFVPFENMIYIGDSDTDVPSLSLVREKGGFGIIVDNLNVNDTERKKRDVVLTSLRKNKRADLITPADYSINSELCKFIIARCEQIRQRYEAEAT